MHRGPDHDGEFVRDDQLSFLLFRSHLLSARLSAEGDELVKAEVAHIGDVYEALQSGLPPEVASLSPAESESDGKLTLQYRVIDRVERDSAASGLFNGGAQAIAQRERSFGELQFTPGSLSALEGS